MSHEAGLLFCYDPPVEQRRDGRQFVARHSKMFMQMFTNLLREVQVMPSEWHLCHHLPNAWSEFMQRLFTAVLEGRRAQLDYQAKQGSLSQAEVTEELSMAWMWYVSIRNCIAMNNDHAGMGEE
ncbi:focadhesin [Elysia marginata]|uniref:Focadhesin n=1 Tax=Elysia marginata TaxID=1093978 RepID=A0AAV4GPH6_9GAST|nr:focadhesin [Elysia marginata]